jgi:bifunctional NMN adenylyltransferase/nudix hydrolase
MKKYKTAVYIGRFQPIHVAHLKTIEEALNLADKLVIVVGSYNRPRTIKNPFTYTERVEIIKNAVSEYFGELTNSNPSWTDKPDPTILNRISFVPVRDYMYNDYKWASEIYSKCLANGATDRKDTVLLGCMKDDSSYYLKMFPQWTFNKMPYLFNLDATHIRNDWFENRMISSENSHKIVGTTLNFFHRFSSISNTWFTNLISEYEFLKEHSAMWSKTKFPVTFTTVDALVIKSGCALVIKRGSKLGKDQYALAGGYLDINETIEDGMLRELKEETKISVPRNVLKGSIKDVKVFDHPKRSLRGRIITHVHLIDLGFGQLPDVKGGDDASSAEWIPIADIMTMEDTFFEDHFDIIVNMISKY